MGMFSSAVRGEVVNLGTRGVRRSRLRGGETLPEEMATPPPPWMVMVPFPALGHVAPMLHLARALHSLHSVRSIIAVPAFIYRRIESGGEGPRTRRSGKVDDAVAFASIPDGMDPDPAPDFSAIEEAMENRMPDHLRSLLESQNRDGGGACACAVVDLLASWAIPVARGCGVPVAGFWPAMLATYTTVSAIPDMIRRGLVSESGIPVDAEAQMLRPVLCLRPNLTTQDLPWLVGDKSSQTKRFMFWLKTLRRSRSLRWLLINTFSEEEREKQEEEQQQRSQMILKLAPLLSTMAIGGKSGIHFWEEEEDKGILEWLSLHKPSSVVYVSFGSWVGPVGEEKLLEMALGLESAGRPFLWVLRPSWRNGLPTGYLDRIAGLGRVVGWAPQAEVLRHVAVACHLTHCGWNSTLESVRGGKTLLCYPIAGDQFVNCAYIVYVWRVGVRLWALERGAVEECVRRLVDDGEDMGRRMRELRDEVDGSDARGRAMRCLESFVSGLRTSPMTDCLPVKEDLSGEGLQ